MPILTQGTLDTLLGVNYRKGYEAGLDRGMKEGFTVGYTQGFEDGDITPLTIKEADAE